MKILFTTSKALGYGGAEVSILQYTGELKKRGHKVIIASSESFEGRSMVRFRSVDKWPYFLRNIYLKKLFARLIRKYSIDLITPQNPATTPAAILAAEECSIPVVVHIRDLWFACPRSSCLRPDYSECVYCSWKRLLSCSRLHRYLIDLYKWKNIKKAWKLINRADAKIVVSTAMKNRLAKCGITNNVNIISGARKLEDFENVKGVKSFKKEYGLRKIVVGFIGSFFYTKGILQVFKFMPEILKENPDVSLLLVGDGPLYPEVKALIKKQGIEKQVVLTGRLPFNKIPLCYAASDILLAPHLWCEPLGATIIEASAAGKPSIISEKGGPADFKNTYDFVLPPENTELWKEKVLYLINNPSKRKAVGRKAKKEVKKMSMESYVDRVHKIYTALRKKKT